MKLRRRWPAYLAFGATVLIVLIVAEALRREPWLQRARVRGSLLTLAGTTYGLQHPLPEWHWWRRLPWKQDAPGSGLNTTTPELGVWIHWNDSRPMIQSHGWVAVMDDHGCRFPREFMFSWHDRIGPRHPGGGTLVWELLKYFPRRSDTVRYCYLDDRGEKPLACFMVPNPAPGPYPDWTAPPYPVSRRAGARLVRLTAIERLPPDPLVSVGTRFEVLEHGRKAPWVPILIRVSDATGNSAESRVTGGSPGGLARFQGLCFEEKAWKLDVHFAPEVGSRLVPDWTWDVPENGAERSDRPIGLSFDQRGLKAEILEVRNDNASRERVVRLRVRYPDPLHLVLAEARDERGRELPLSGVSWRGYPTQWHPGGTEAYELTLRNIGGATRLRLKLHFFRTFSASFLAAPPK